MVVHDWPIFMARWHHQRGHTLSDVCVMNLEHKHPKYQDNSSYLGIKVCLQRIGNADTLVYIIKPVHIVYTCLYICIRV